ncbi:MAG TPA: hypothetical protein VGQ55_15500 [Pyrinomonadaceae bacterium]|jgi:hypothetical protein|nr:hypothetical protein [Pyrinomonadaceae bacterium]
MKKGVLLSLVFVAIAALNTFGQPNDLSIHNLVGKVKRFDEQLATLEEKNGVVKEHKSVSKASRFFDENGRLSHESFSGTTSSERQFIYEKNGVRKSVTETTQPFEKPGSVKIPSYSVSIFKYDEKDNSMSQDIYHGKIQAGPLLETGDPGNKYKYFFDNENRLTKEILMEPDGKEIMTEEYFYRGSGPTASDIVLLSKGRALQFIKCTYEVDALGNWTKKTAVRKPVDPRKPTVNEVTYRKITYYKN